MRTPSLCLLTSLLAACGTAPRPAPGLARCIWVDRWDYTSAADVEKVMADCSGAGFTAVMFQVRGNGTASWSSRIESWSERFGHKDPGFDPLAVAVRAAHAHNLQLHAWINVVPGWIGDKEPTDPRQLWRAHRAWFVQDHAGNFQSRKAGKYLALNPCLPEVRQYLADLCGEVAGRYAVDGIHLDYIRFPDGEGDDADALADDPATRAAYSTATGRASADRSELRAWKTRCVTAVVEGIRATTRSAAGRPVFLSAAVWADRARALAAVRQDWADWCKRGLVDAVFPMNYTADDGQFAARARDAVAVARGRSVVMGIGTWRHADAQQSIAQMDAALHTGAAGVAVFNYRTLFGKPEKGAADKQAELRRQLAAWCQSGGKTR